MKRFLAVATLFAGVIAGLVYLLSDDLAKANIFFEEKIRSSLFSGLLTVGSFLLSLKVFIVVKFKETVFDSLQYKEQLQELRKVNPDLEHYRPVRDLSSVLFISIASAIIGAACQLTIGLLGNTMSMLVSIFMAAFAGAMLMQTLVLIRSIITSWLDYMEVKPKKIEESPK